VTQIQCLYRMCKQIALGMDLRCSYTNTTSVGTGCSVEGAEAFSLLQIRSAAENRIGMSEESLPLTCAILKGEPIVCAQKKPAVPKISVLHVAAIGSTSVQLAWTLPAGYESFGGNFEVQRDDWWFGTPLATMASVNVSLSYIMEGLLPATRYHTRVRSVPLGRGTAGEWSETLAVTTKDAGACGTEDNLASQKQHFADMKSTIQSCLIGALGNADRASKCITSKIGFDDSCSQCWVAEGQCAASKCFMCITSPQGQPCQDCCIRTCFPPLIQCSGLPTYTYPRK